MYTTRAITGVLLASEEKALTTEIRFLSKQTRLGPKEVSKIQFIFTNLLVIW